VLKKKNRKGELASLKQVISESVGEGLPMAKAPGAPVRELNIYLHEQKILPPGERGMREEPGEELLLE